MKNFIASLIDNGFDFVTSNDTPARHRAKRLVEVGCKIRIPKDAPLMQLTRVDDYDRHYQILVLPTKFVYSDGERQNNILFIGSLVKSVRRADHTLVRAQGSVAEFMDSCKSLDEQLAVLRGSTIKVSAMTEVEDFRGRHHRVYCFDFV